MYFCSLGRRAELTWWFLEIWSNQQTFNIFRCKHFLSLSLYFSLSLTMWISLRALVSILHIMQGDLVPRVRSKPNKIHSSVSLSVSASVSLCLSFYLSVSLCLSLCFYLSLSTSVVFSLALLSHYYWTFRAGAKIFCKALTKHVDWIFLDFFLCS